MDRLRQDARSARPGNSRLRARWAAVLVGFREPIVVILLMAASLIMISGRPINSGLLLLVAISLAWDAARSPRGAAGPAGAETRPSAAPAMPAQGEPSSGLLVTVRWRPPVIVALVAGGAVYAAVVGAFTRYSWPATAGVISLAAGAVVLGWRGPLRPRPDAGKIPAAGAALWIGLLLAAGMWELAALFLQPTLNTMSYAHPTISELTSPLLATHAGRSVALGLWVAIGGYLVRR